jgi:hypothetical protein
VKIGVAEVRLNSDPHTLLWVKHIYTDDIVRMRRIGSFSVVQASMEFLVHCCSDISLVSEFLEVEFLSKKPVCAS